MVHNKTTHSDLQGKLEMLPFRDKQIQVVNSTAVSVLIFPNVKGSKAQPHLHHLSLHPPFSTIIKNMTLSDALSIQLK